MGTIKAEAEGASMEVDGPAAPEPPPGPKPGLHVHPRRAALIKSLQNFVKRARVLPAARFRPLVHGLYLKVIFTPDMAELTRTLMGGPLPRTLAHIISNADYYGPALFLQSMEIVQAFIQAEPGQLSTLQARGLTAIVQVTPPLPTGEMVR